MLATLDAKGEWMQANKKQDLEILGLAHDGNRRHSESLRYVELCLSDAKALKYRTKIRSLMRETRIKMREFKKYIDNRGKIYGKR